MNMDQDILLQMTDITKTFPGVKALDHVSLTLKRGTVHALMGENGAGKSTLMKCLFGIYNKDSGTILLEGKEVNFKNSREALDNGVAMVHQELNQALKRSVMDNIWLGRYPKHLGLVVDETKMYRETMKIFDELGINVDPRRRDAAGAIFADGAGARCACRSDAAGAAARALPRARPSLRDDPAAARLRCGAVGPLRPVSAAAAAGHGPRVGLAEAVRPSLRRSRPPCWRCAPSLPSFLCSDTGGYLMKIAIACDHGALALKEAVKAHLTARGMECVDFGTFTADSCDYPDFARPAAEAVSTGACERGIVMCTTGIGVSITANKVHGIRCALLSDPVSARLTREHNDANMMALGAGFVGELLALEIVDTFLDTPFSNGERHKRRIEKLMAVEQG